MSAGRGRFFRCPTIFGDYTDKPKFGNGNTRTTVVACGYEGQAMKVLKPRPSTKPTRVCPSCLVEAK